MIRKLASKNQGKKYFYVIRIKITKITNLQRDSFDIYKINSFII